MLFFKIFIWFNIDICIVGEYIRLLNIDYLVVYFPKYLTHFIFKPPTVLLKVDYGTKMPAMGRERMYFSVPDFQHSIFSPP